MPVMEKEKVINQQKTKKMLAFEAMEQMKIDFPFLKDLDWEAEREQAMIEKYGYFD